MHTRSAKYICVMYAIKICLMTASTSYKTLSTIWNDNQLYVIRLSKDKWNYHSTESCRNMKEIRM